MPVSLPPVFFPEWATMKVACNVRAYRVQLPLQQGVVESNPGEHILIQSSLYGHPLHPWKPYAKHAALTACLDTTTTEVSLHGDLEHANRVVIAACCHFIGTWTPRFFVRLQMLLILILSPPADRTHGGHMAREAVRLPYLGVRNLTGSAVAAADAPNVHMSILQAYCQRITSAAIRRRPCCRRKSDRSHGALKRWEHGQRLAAGWHALQLAAPITRWRGPQLDGLVACTSREQCIIRRPGNVP
eukprot:365123-Chlamydomonas_euryale.AAC.8